MERNIEDMFGNGLKKGDSICFTLSIRIDEKPIVKAKIGGFIYGKTCNDTGQYTDWIIIDRYIETGTVEQARREKKLVQKVLPGRVVKCY